jgi:hypothetical protein
MTVAVAATDYSFASPWIADERDLPDEAEESCRMIVTSRTEALGEFGFEQQVRVLEARRTVQRMGKH